MKKIIILLIITLLFISITSCSSSPGEIDNAIEEYKDNLRSIFSELKAEYNSNPSPEKWQSFSTEWMDKLGVSKPQLLNEKLDNKYSNSIQSLDYTKNQLLYLWNEYNLKITKDKINNERIQELQKEITENLK